jgi:ASC-1-like (ASCH) protein
MTTYPEPMSPVQAVWFDEIAAGRKLVEGRAGPPHKYDAFLGKIICLRRGGDEVMSVLARVAAVRHYATLEQYIRGEGWDKIAPHLYLPELSDTQLNMRTRDAYLAIFAPSVQPNRADYQVFSPNRVSGRGGINAVELQVVGARTQLPGP